MLIAAVISRLGVNWLMSNKTKKTVSAEIPIAVPEEVHPNKMQLLFLQTYNGIKSVQELAQETGLTEKMVKQSLKGLPKSPNFKGFIRKNGSVVMTEGRSMADDKLAKNPVKTKTQIMEAKKDYVHLLPTFYENQELPPDDEA